MATKTKTTTYEQALRKMRKFQDEYACAFHCIIGISTYYNGTDHRSIELTASVWDKHDEPQFRKIEWSDFTETANSFSERFEKFRNDFHKNFVEGVPTIIEY